MWWFRRPPPPPAPIAGVVPSLALSYSSDALDAYTNDTNNQGSWVGAGWGLSTGFIERGYKACANDAGSSTNGNQCWYTDANGVRDQLTISLNGTSSRLVPIAANEWRLEDDPGWRVERAYGGACLGGDPTLNEPGKGGPLVDNDNEYFIVTTPNGVKYVFGCGREPNTSLYTNSVWAEPVVGNDPSEPCYTTSTFTQWCYQAYRWNLDRITAPTLTNSGTGTTNYAVTTLYYAPEINYYNTQLSAPAVKPYVRAGNVAAIGYTKRNGSEAEAPPAKVVFRTENRCINLDVTCDTTVLPTSANATSYPDVPVDLICAASSCSKTAPSFFTTKRLKAIDTFVQDSSIGGTEPGYRLLDRVSITHEFPWDGTVDTLRKLWVRNIQRKASISGILDATHNPDNCTTDSLCTPAVRFDSASNLQNRVDPSGSLMKLFRIDSVKDELGAETKVTYGQPDPCSPVPYGTWNTNTKDCFPVFNGTGFNVYNKYLVTRIDEYDRTGSGSATMSTTYTYIGGAGWHSDGDFTRSSAQQSWSDFRGYAQVVTRRG